MEAIEPSPVDVWAWASSPKSAGLDDLLRIRTHVLSHRGARRDLDARLRELGDVEAGSSDDSLRVGIAYWLRGDYSRAHDYIADHAGGATGAFVYAECCLFGGQTGYDGSVARPSDAAKALSKHASASHAHTALHLRALHAADDAAGAAKAFAAASDTFKSTADGLYYAGYGKEIEGEYDEAWELYDKALEVDPSHTQTLFHRAYHSDLSGDDEDAIDLYEKLSEVQPVCVNTLMNLGLLYEDSDLYPEAVHCYKRVLAAYPQHPRARLFLKDAEASLNMYYDEDQEVRNDKKAQILKIPISDFELSVRSRNCLAKMNIGTLGDLVLKTENELLSYKNFGETSLNEIKQILDSKGLRLGMKPEDDLLPVRKGPGGAPGPAVAATGGRPSPAFNIDPNDERLKRPVSDLLLSVRARKCLANLNIKSLGELCAYTSDELLAQRNFGVTSLKEITDQLESMNLSLRTIDK